MRFIKKLFVFLFITCIVLCFSAFMYVKLSPKIIINSANNIILYDKNDVSFFKGNHSNEWVNLDNISTNLINSTTA